ncbi:hypothetical protein PRIPAC_71002 [Pristionchus pacificus]|uniref:Uncharacterized protein n=1 Tax=Pristionchus pacificus TaxID=54126 RepID=A0A2A6C1Z2_PRIPA|nr:hypothetical protein PRIPAC_71002 [Pristionchus pacificus]|eukprot:PDM72043.1 hypothetical protein PRIPAC_38450 [Pristionchus pacificus]
MFTMYSGPDSGFSSPLSTFPSCSSFDPLSPSMMRIRRRLSYESIDTPATREAATQTDDELSVGDIIRCRRVGRKLLAICDEFDREFFQPAHKSEAVSPSSSPSYSSLVADFFRSFF